MTSVASKYPVRLSAWVGTPMARNCPANASALNRIDRSSTTQSPNRTGRTVPSRSTTVWPDR